MRAPRLQKEQLEASATDFVVRLTFLGLFAWWSLELVRPFVPIVIWAILLAVALYPAYAWLARRLGGRRGLAAVTITLIALATVLGPVSVLAASLAESVQWLASGLSSGTLKVPPPPAGVDDWPVLGKQIDEAWTLAANNLDDAVLRYGSAVLPAGGTVLGKVAALGVDSASASSRPSCRGRSSSASSPASRSILVGQLKRITGVDIEAYGLIAPLVELAQKAATIHADVHGLLDRADLLAAIDPAMIFDDLDDALRAFETTPAKEETQ